MKMQEFWEKFNSNESLVDFVFYLRDRWVEEGEYEDINDYLKAIQKRIPDAYKIYKRPFGFVAKCDDGDIKITVKVKGNQYSVTGESIEKASKINPMDKLMVACKKLVDRTSVNAGFIRLHEDKGVVYILMNGVNIDVLNCKDRQLKERVVEILGVIDKLDKSVKSITMPLNSDHFGKWEYFDSEEEKGSIDLYIRKY